MQGVKLTSSFHPSTCQLAPPFDVLENLLVCIHAASSFSSFLRIIMHKSCLLSLDYFGLFHRLQTHKNVTPFLATHLKHMLVFQICYTYSNMKLNTKITFFLFFLFHFQTFPKIKSFCILTSLFFPFDHSVKFSDCPMREK